MNEQVTKAAQGMGMVCDDLRQALNKANPVEGIVLLQLVREASELRQRIEALEVALNQQKR